MLQQLMCFLATSGIEWWSDAILETEASFQVSTKAALVEKFSPLPRFTAARDGLPHATQANALGFKNPSFRI